MIYHVQAPTPRALANHVQPIAKPHFDRLNLLPYNRFEPEDTEWWLVPSSADPAYCNTKYHFGFDLDEFGGRTGLLTVGLQAEKGLGEKVRAVYPGARGASWIMTNEWHWPILMKQIRSGKLLKAIAAASAAVGEPLTVEIYSGAPPDPEGGYAPDSPLRKKDRATYSYDAVRGELALRWPVDSPQNVLREMPERLSNDGLAVQLDTLTKSDWMWVDFYVYATFRPYREGAPADQVWETKRLWKEYLSLLAFAIG